MSNSNLNVPSKYCRFDDDRLQDFNDVVDIYIDQDYEAALNQEIDRFMDRMSFEEAKNCLDDFIKEKATLCEKDKNQFYALLQQANVGANKNKNPNIKTAKEEWNNWNAWEAKKGLSKDDAKKDFISQVKSQV